MYLNQFISFKLEQEFEDKYNMMVIKEVLDNKDKYPRIYPCIENEVEFDDNDKLIKKKYDFQYFEADDPEGCADFLDTMELYKAFVNVLLKDIRHKDVYFKSCTFGVDLLRNPNVECIINPYLNYSGTSYVTITNTSKTIVKEIYEPNIVDGAYYGHIATETQINKYYEDNQELLKKLKESLFVLYDANELFIPHFTNEVLRNLKVELKDGIYGYIHDFYAFRIGNNYIKFYTTERGFDPFGLIRLPIQESLSDKQQALEAAKLFNEPKIISND